VDDRHAAHPLPPDIRDLDAVPSRVHRHHGRDALLDEVDVLDGRVRLNEHVLDLKRDRNEVGLEQGQVLAREHPEQLVADEG
jgi:hypothetical protein